MIFAPEVESLATVAATILIVGAGFLLMLQQRRWAGQFFLAGIVVVIGATLLPGISTRLKAVR